jgi:myo-inositol-1(or 4)-monophosphatase
MYDVEFVSGIIKKAGKLARSYFLDVDPKWKADRSLVTEADLAVQTYLAESFDRRYPQDGLVGEENGLSKPPTTGDRYWVIDPIDGTASFSAGLPVWGIAIGLVVEGEPIAGFFYAPTVDDLIHTTPDGKVLRNGKTYQLQEPDPFGPETSLFIASRLHLHYKVSKRYPGKLRNLGSTLAHLGYVAVGSAAGALVERVYIWDIAAGMAMLANVGGVLRYIDGAPVSAAALLAGQRAPLPMLAGHPATVKAFGDVIEFTDWPSEGKH